MCASSLARRFQLLLSLSHRVRAVLNSKTQLGFHRCIDASLLTTSRQFSSTKQHSFTVSYLINSCGLSLESAVSASKKVLFETPDRPNSVLSLLKQHGFSNTHITKVVKSYPPVLLSSPEKTLLPKLHLFHSIGISGTDIADIFVRHPPIFWRSLENQLIPVYDALKSVFLEDDKVVEAMKRSVWLFANDAKRNLAHNIASLKHVGVPESYLSSAILLNCTAVLKKHELFEKGVQDIIHMGYDPKKTEFVHALAVYVRMSESTRKSKMEAYMKLGLSEADVQRILRKYPACFTVSVKKITSTMDFFVSKIGCQPQDVLHYPLIVCFSLERRIIPRCSVIKLLWMKGLVKKELSLGTVLQIAEKRFLEKFVIKYQDRVPQLLDVYRGKVDLSELGIGVDESLK